MKVTLLMATTLNGFIADKNDDTDWVKDLAALNQTIAEFGIIVMGRRTYDESAKYNVFPYPKAINIVMTHDQALQAKSTDDVIFSSATPEEVTQLAKQKGFDRLLIIGGGNINGAFLNAGLIDELILDIHPYLLSDGIKLFQANFEPKNFEFVDTKVINDGIVQVKYKVKK